MDTDKYITGQGGILSGKKRKMLLKVLQKFIKSLKIIVVIIHTSVYNIY